MEHRITDRSMNGITRSETSKERTANKNGNCSAANGNIKGMNFKQCSKECVGYNAAKNEES